ncbi:MAG TPA: hypothetical protein VFP87_15525 [Chitinophagaceae bacterium]|nr:hypothetical protein [Chitinophagaceae bacterium]
MPILQIEHAVPSFEGWKKAFDNDPVGRQQGGVLSYRIARKVDDPNFVIIELEFKSVNEAENFHSKLKKLWGTVEGSVMRNPQARIIDIVEAKS